MKRLEAIEPKFASSLAAVDDTKLRAAAMEACLFVVQAIGVKNELVPLALEELKTNGIISLDVRNKLDSEADALDEQYLKIYQKAPEHKESYQDYFNQARVLSAISLAGLDDPKEAAMESIYEASQAMSDNRELLEKLSNLLQLQ